MKNVFFIGNSLIGTSSIPEQTAKLFADNGDAFSVSKCKKDGYRLSDHEADFCKGEFENELSSADIVVVQEFGTEYYTTRASVEKIIARVKPDAEIYFLLTEWDVTRNRINELRGLNVKFIPAGYVHEHIVNKNILDYDDLHLPEDYHPNYFYGTISAATVYTCITGDLPKVCDDDIKALADIIKKEVETEKTLKSVLVVGGGGREHTIIRSLIESRRTGLIYAAPGNGGTELDFVENVNIKATDVDGVVKFAKEKAIDFVVVAPDDPLMLGMVDALEKEGIKAFGPHQNAAIIEGSKVFSKQLMKKYGIPTANFEVFDDYEKACEYVKNHGAPIVVKADGLALGKGVVVAQTVEEAIDALTEIMCDKVFGESGAQVVIEDCLTGREISVLAFTDGKTLRPMVSAQDHKRAYDGNKGPNTGGMGTFAPSPIYTPAVAEECMKNIFIPTVNAMKAEGRTFKGVLYFGLMLTENGVNVIEYNARFGDPETQVVLPLLDGDLFEIMEAVVDERLDEVEINWLDAAAVCVVIASGGYPKSYAKGYDITFDEGITSTVYHAGTAIKDGMLVTSGGRVLGVTAVNATLKEAAADAYEDVKKIHFKDSFCRSDIAKGL
ncbi:MAG: phosphoribosylamine--glycine ligase [Ruminococcaceae bacterium]|nr:phosphoribosylamine--glycine ligase [Oscillospiraceae bacterium]